MKKRSSGPKIVAKLRLAVAPIGHIKLYRCLLFFLMISFTAVAAEKDFFEPFVSTERWHEPQQIYPRGRLFPFSLFSVLYQDLQSLKKDGFTAIGPYYEDQGDFKEGHGGVLEHARIAGLKSLYRVGIEMNFLGDDPLDLTAEQIRKEITRQVSLVANNPEIAWWNLHPEEMRHWVKREMDYMKVAYEAIRAADPFDRPVWMYEPNHRGSAGLITTIAYQDICGKGTYVNHTGFRDKRIWARWSIEEELGTIEKANKPAIPIAVLEMYKDAEPQHAHLIQSWIRHDAYLSIVLGAKGIIVWSGYRNRKGFEEHFDDYYRGYASVAKELNGKKALGRVCLFGQRRADIAVDIKSGPKTLSIEYDNEKCQYPSVAFADIAYDRDRYLFMVNSANEPVVAEVSGLPSLSFYRHDLFDEGKIEACRNSFTTKIPALGVKAFMFGSDNEPRN